MPEKLPVILQIVLFFSLLLPTSINATVYYVSSEGNDSNPGTSESTSWKTLDKVNSFKPKPGDKILFRRGDEWTGTLTISNSGSYSGPIVYGAYGTGTLPKIYGSEIITGWTQYRENIYKAPFDQVITQLFLNDERMRVARYPDQGYHRVKSVSAGNIISSDNLSDTIDYTGAVWLGRTNYWVIENIKVNSSDKKVITLASAPSHTSDAGEGFILVGKLEFLNQPGEWYYDISAKTVYLWTPNNDSPDNYVVRGSTMADGIFGNNMKFFVIRDLEILQHKENGIRLTFPDYVTIENCHIHDQERMGISNDTRSNNLVIRNNLIEKTNCMGIWLWNANGVLIEGNTIQHIAQWNTLGLDGIFRSNSASAMEVSGDDSPAKINGIIQYNRIDNVGGCGIFYRRMKYIQYNYITYAGMIKDDGGAIYTNTSGKGSVIRYNICLYSKGEKEGYTSSRALKEGIYIDETAEDVIVEYNTIQHTTDAGIKLHNVGNITVNNNTIMSARYGIWCNKYLGSPSTITNNIVYMTTNTDEYEPRPLFALVGSYNAFFNHNKYFNPTVQSTSQVFKEKSRLTFDQWKSVTKQDANSKFSSTPLATGESAELVFNASRIQKRFDLNDALVKDIDGKQISGSFILEPYTSIILTGKNIATISEYTDTIPPVISSFSMPVSSTSLRVEFLSLTVTDDVEVKGYKLTETPATPLAGDSGWSAGVPVSYTFADSGTYTLYAWAKDAAGNISKAGSATVNVQITTSAGIYGKEQYMKLYPNPFNNQVTINIPATGRDIGIDIYDVSGSLVKRINNKEKVNNFYQVKWDGRNENGIEAAPGIYYIWLKNGDEFETIKALKE